MRFAVGLGVVALVLVVADAARAQAPVPCTSIGGGRYECDWYIPGDGRTAGSLVVRDRTTVGYLHQGRNWIVCQQRGGDMRTLAGYRNHWFGYTLADNSKWGWASALEARGGDNYGPFANVPNCNGAYGNPPLWSGVWGQPPPPPPPPPPTQDHDRDAVLPPLDCDDRNARRHPGAADIPGNRIDENCDGADAALPPGAPPARITAGVRVEWTVRGRVTRLRELGVRDAPPGARVRVSCRRKKRCALRKRRTVRVGRRGRASLMRVFRRHRVRGRAVIEVRITAPNMVGKVVRYRTRRGAIPRDRVLCLPPGKRKPKRCG